MLTARAHALPLSGVRVLDFTQGMAALSTLMLADFGAEVIKIEPPAGDWAREEPAFAMWNRGKQSMVLDLQTVQGRDAVRQLAADSDVIVEAFRPGVMQKHGLGYHALSEANPRIVYCSITGFGPVESLAGVKGYEALVAAKIGRMLGLDEITGAATDTPRDRPIFLSIPVFSYAASQLAVQGILAALFARAQSGVGDHVKTSLLQGALATVMRQSFGKAAAPASEHDLTYRGIKLCFLTVQCSDGKYIQMCARQDQHFRNWLDALGLSDMSHDPRYANGPLKIKNTDDIEYLEKVIRERMRTRTQAEWMRLFIEDYDIGADPFLLPREFLQHPQLKANELVMELEHPRKGKIAMLGPVVKLFETQAQPARPEPQLGEHTQALLAALNPEKVSSDRTRSAHRAALPPPLAGITILEIAYFVAAPLGATILAELGARVIKVEPSDGDPWRRVGLESVHMLHGKESIVLDLKGEADKQVLKKLIAEADVLLTNFRPGVPERLGFDYQSAKAFNPQIVYIYAGSYGPKGPEAHRPAFHSTPNALSGGGILQAGQGNAPVDDSYPDPCAGLAVGTAIALGLLARARTGASQYIETNMLCSTGYAMSRYLVSGGGENSWRIPDHGQHGVSALRWLYECREGWLMLDVNRDAEWRALAAALGRQAWLTDPRFGNPQAREAHDDLLVEELTQLFADASAAEWETRLSTAGVPAVRADEQSFPDFVMTQGLATHASHAHFGNYWRLPAKITFGGRPVSLRPAAALGEHTEALLREFGLDKNIERVNA